MTLSSSQRSKIKKAIENHENYQNCFHWTTKGMNRQYKDRVEKRDSFVVSFKHNGATYEYESFVRVSGYFLYTGYFSINGERKDVRLFKNLLRQKPKARKKTLTQKQIDGFSQADLMRILDTHKDKLIIFDGRQCTSIPDVDFVCANGPIAVQLNTVDRQDYWSSAAE